MDLWWDHNIVLVQIIEHNLVCNEIDPSLLNGKLRGTCTEKKVRLLSVLKHGQGSLGFRLVMRYLLFSRSDMKE